MAEPTWTTVPDLAEMLGTDVLAVRHLLADRTLVGVRGDDGILRVPGEFVAEGQVLKGLTGVLTVLRDGGWDDEAVLGWLFADDPTLPGAPVQALMENRGTEVKRRAQALAW
ncbi:MAG TPA: Rv2175c family DNA-binding protein [Mycobacteriales bacterium]